MSVVKLVRRSNRETVELARAMLELAERGDLHDVDVTMRLDDGEHTVRTGLYRSSPAHALRAVMRQVIELCGLD